MVPIQCLARRTGIDYNPGTMIRLRGLALPLAAAGSRDFSQDDSARLQRAMKAMADDGSYARILKKYGL